MHQVVRYTYITTSLLVLTFYQFQSSVITLPPFTSLCFSLFINVLNISCTCTEMLIIYVATIQHNLKNSGRKVCWIYLYFDSFHCSSVLMSQNSPLYNFVLRISFSYSFRKSLANNKFFYCSFIWQCLKNFLFILKDIFAWYKILGS